MTYRWIDRWPTGWYTERQTASGEFDVIPDHHLAACILSNQTQYFFWHNWTQDIVALTSNKWISDFPDTQPTPRGPKCHVSQHASLLSFREIKKKISAPRRNNIRFENKKQRWKQQVGPCPRALLWQHPNTCYKGQGHFNIPIKETSSVSCLNKRQEYVEMTCISVKNVEIVCWFFKLTFP